MELHNNDLAKNILKDGISQLTISRLTIYEDLDSSIINSSSEFGSFSQPCHEQHHKCYSIKCIFSFNSSVYGTGNVGNTGI